ncbi:hypothetical protein CWE21_10550 [Pseudidiomarina aquimaris]|uniref:Uncharacterized protein n=1 Tax=Pseudidiomarina aquimaris TaxID=641841 RepID=A0A432XCX3_9GAMM|nr:hypothetical protein [Pseudidiomarina aquimaris]RUO46588.1 hypothetical protein CWE21_10550 [Pseudidiomarina aquimaris]
MTPQNAEPRVFSLRAADKKLFRGLCIAGLLFLASYFLSAPELAITLGFESLGILAGVLSYAAQALLIVHLLAYIFKELARED